MIHCGDHGNPVDINGTPLNIISEFGCLFDAFMRGIPRVHRETIAELLLFSLKIAFGANGVGEIEIDEDAAKRAAEEYMASLIREKKGE